MKIATPPPSLPEFNLSKQKRVFDMVYNHWEDVILPARKATVSELATVHDLDYVNDVFNHGRANGFGDWDTDKLDHALLSCGAMMAAAEAAVDGGADGKHVAFAPASGFHHAGYNYNGGFCTFNGLVLAAMKLRQAEKVPNGVLIIDGDGHYGDGTEDLIQQHDLEWLSNVLLDKGTHQSVGRENERIHTAITHKPPSLVIYQAGADCHIDDPYKAGYLTDTQWALRDNVVFDLCRLYDVPVAWCLAGGYNGLKTLNLHNRTFVSALQAYYPESTRLISAPVDSSNKSEQPSP